MTVIAVLGHAAAASISRSGGALPITTATSSTRNTSGATCSQSPWAAQAASSISILSAIARSNQSSHCGESAGAADHQRCHGPARAGEEGGEVAVGGRAVDLEGVGASRVAEVLDARAVLVAPEARKLCARRVEPEHRIGGRRALLSRRFPMLPAR